MHSPLQCGEELILIDFLLRLLGKFFLVRFDRLQYWPPSLFQAITPYVIIGRTIMVYIHLSMYLPSLPSKAQTC